MTDERWAPVPGFEGYEVSNLGRARKRAWQYLNPAVSSNGYGVLRISNNSHGKYLLFHRVIWAAFHGPIPEGYQVNHVDGKKLNNRLSNLEALSPADHARHTRDNIVIRGESVHTAKLTAAGVQEIRRLLSEGHTPRELAERFGVSRTMIYRIRSRQAWSHVA